LVAFFTDLVQITVLANPPEAGTVTGDGFYTCYENVTVTATVTDDCYTFSNWTDEDGTEVSTNNPYTFTVIESQTLIANFAVKVFNVYVMANPTGGGTAVILGGNNAHNCGDTARVQAIPNTCYHFVNWTTADGAVVSTQPLYEFPVTGLTVLIANFAKDICEITLIANPPEGGILLGAGTYECGDPAVAMAFTNPCYTFINWTKNGVQVSTQENYAFTVEETCTLIANFELNYYYIDVSPSPSNGGLAIESGSYECGTMQTFTAIPFSDYNFIGWKENGAFVSTDNPWSFEITEPRILLACFSLNTYEVTVSAEPSECGEVSGDGVYEEGTLATVTVTPNPNGCCHFIGWQENGVYVSVQLSYSFIVTGNHHLVAIFDLKVVEVNLSTNPSEGGTVSGGGSFDCGEIITITATLNDCWEFVNWTDENGTEVSTDNPWSFEVTESCNLTANFVLSNYDIVVQAEPIEGGEVSGDGNYDCGTTATVTATPDFCYTFTGWWTPDGDLVSMNNPYEFNVIENDTLVAHFEMKHFSVILLTEPTMGGEVSGGGVNIPCKYPVVITATPNACYTFAGWWTQDGDSVSMNNPYIFNVIQNTTLVAHFEVISYELTLLANPPECGTVEGAGIYDCGDAIPVKATPNTGYDFVKWTTKNGLIVLSTEAEFDVTVNKDTTLVAHFIPKIFDITLEINAKEGHCGTVSGDGSYQYGDTITVVATVVEDCCGFANWTINGVVVSTNAIYTFVVTDSVTLIANFEIPRYRVTALANDTALGSTTGTDWYDACTEAEVRAFKEECYRFVNWTTIDGIEVSRNPVYKFEVTEDITLIANFDALDFDTYSPTLWNNTFMLNLRKLREEGYEVIGCRWFKNGIEEIDTRTINEFSYSAGPKITDLLEPEPTYYSFRLLTRNRGELCSTLKFINTDYMPPAPDNKLWAYPNPVMAGMPFTVEGVVKGDEVKVYNQSGFCVYNGVAAGETITLALNVEAGVYLVWADGKQVKVIVIR